MQCGGKLELRRHESEGIIPWCENCGDWRFPVFNTAVSMIITNRTADRVLLILQYGKPTYVFVAGYVNKGEDAEAAAIREVSEELGMTVWLIKPSIDTRDGADLIKSRIGLSCKAQVITPEQLEKALDVIIASLKSEAKA